jgi:hypothetical protein
VTRPAAVWLKQVIGMNWFKARVNGQEPINSTLGGEHVVTETDNEYRSLNVSSAFKKRESARSTNCDYVLR